MTDSVNEAHGAGRKAIDDDRYEAAVGHLNDAIADAPESAACHYDLGRAYFLLWRFEEGEAAFRRCLELDPEYTDAAGYLGRCLDGLGHADKAAATYQDVLDKRPDHAAVHLLLAQLQLSRGYYAEGWEEYEWRYRGEGGKPYPDFDFPQWNGEPLKGKSIFVFGEQGYGDTLHFARYVPMVKALGATVIYGVGLPLKRLIKSSPVLDGSIDKYTSNWPKPGTLDYHCPLSGLPRAFKTTAVSIPADIPYIEAKPRFRRRWSRRLQTLTNPRIGVCWAGRPTHPNDRYRSVDFDVFQDALLPGLNYVSLQIGDRSDDLQRQRVPIHTWRDWVTDFADTAAIVAELDLIITVDTSVAHLAGALGKDTWLLLPYVADWRWGRGRSDSPWYPSMRLFRQSAPADWQSVVAEVRAELEQRY